MKKVFFMALAILLMAIPAMADNLTFSWDANTEPGDIPASEVPSLESDYSNEVSVTISNAPAPPSVFQGIIEVVLNFFKWLFGGLRVA